VSPTDGDGHRSGFACLVGRPNAGKSTLTNAMVGQKVAITSAKPQTTRHTIRGIVSRPDAQLVIVDTPGFHRPRTLLGERLNDLVRGTLAEVDVLGLCIPANEKIGPGDRYIAGELAKAMRKRSCAVAVVTKTDTVGRQQVAEQLLAVSKLARDAGIEFAEIVPVSAVRGEQVELLAELLTAQLPPGPALYPDGELSDSPEEQMVAELIREAALEGVRDELPHSLAVVVEEMLPREGRSPENPLLDVRAELYVERDSQKGIVIGKKGAVLKQVGIAVRQQLPEGAFLELVVKVDKDWQRRPRALERLGY
jgi:GTP-binding protein Era